jgi:hypothetical protein
LKPKDSLLPSLLVTRSEASNVDGYVWSVTFVVSSILGNVPQLVASREGLDGVNTTIAVETVVEGNEIAGTYALLFDEKQHEASLTLQPSKAYELESGGCSLSLFLITENWARDSISIEHFPRTEAIGTMAALPRNGSFVFQSTDPTALGATMHSVVKGDANFGVVVVASNCAADVSFSSPSMHVLYSTFENVQAGMPFQISVSEGGTASKYAITLDSDPDFTGLMPNTVIVQISTDGELSVSPTEVAFTPHD